MSPQATTTEARAPRARAPQQEKPPLATTKESPRAATNAAKKKKKEVMGGKEVAGVFPALLSNPSRGAKGPAKNPLVWPFPGSAPVLTSAKTEC